tara:strand:+ start:613 stop:858 length:246 start_codon:yes stop_codon:yes gene_type:complete
MTEPLRPKEVELFEYLEGYIRKNKYAPRLLDITKEFNYSPRSNDMICRRLKRLEEAGLISRVPMRVRGITITGSLEGQGFA